MKSDSFFAELKRRNVYKVAVAYAVVSWLLIQIATQVFPFFEIPNWAVRLVVILLILGFPIALILSWAFEITPEGIKRESEVSPNQSIAAHTGRKLVVLTVIIAAFAAGLFAWQISRSHRSTVGEAASFPAKQSGKLTASPTTESLADAAPVSDKSIAVLPFDNLSDDKSNAYFAEGIQDEILTRLSKIAALKVISRTSTKKYQSAPDNLKDVARDLGVAHVLEGSVQKIANAVKVNVQLIRAVNDEHVWAESYNRKLDDVFGVEGEVANAIAEQLQAKLTGAEVKAISDKPTQNAAAYDAYLRGLAIEHNDYSYGSFVQASHAYVRAVELDPKFAIAWARLGIIRSFLYFNGVAPQENTAASVKEGADRAMALAPEGTESWVALGAYRYRVQRDFEGALVAYQEALKRSPNNSFVYQYLGIVYRRLGKWQEAELNYKKALELDPRDVALLNDMGNDLYYYLRRFDDAYAVLNRSQELAPDSEAVRANKVNVLQARGRLNEARQQLSQLPENSTDSWVVNARINQAIYERRFDEAVRVVERKLTADTGQPEDFFDKLFLVNLAYCHEWLGHAEEARNAFTRAVLAFKPTPETLVGPDANGTPTTLALAYAGLGEKEKALAQAQQALKDYATDAVFKPTAEITLAQIQARFGDHEAAIAALPHLLEVPAGLNVTNLEFDPMWDPLRKDPRFQKLVAEGAPPSPSKQQK